MISLCWGKWIKDLDKNLKTRRFDRNLFSLVFVFLHSDSTDPEADDSDDQTAWDSVSSLQRRAPLPSLKEGGKPEEHSPELRGLGVRRGTSSWPPQVFWGHIPALHRQQDVFSKQDHWSKGHIPEYPPQNISIIGSCNCSFALNRQIWEWYWSSHPSLSKNVNELTFQD